MRLFLRRKAALMAASSLIASAGALGAASASDFDAAAYPATVEASVMTDAAQPADEEGDSVPRWALAAIGAGALAGLIKLIGVRKLLTAAGTTASQATKIAGKTAGAAVKAASKAFASPLRFAALFAGLALFAMTGIGLYDIEWIGGMIAGAAMAGLTAYAGMKAKGALKSRPARVQPDRVSEN